jgi:predicted HD phosphohydrolase
VHRHQPHRDAAAPQAETEDEKAILTPAGLSVADEELVVVALLHDIGETLSPINHGEVAAGTPARSLILSVSVCECMTRPRTLTPNP